VPCRAAPSEQCPESFNTRLRDDELLNGEIFYSLRAAKIIIAASGGAPVMRDPDTRRRLKPETATAAATATATAAAVKA